MTFEPEPDGTLEAAVPAAAAALLRLTRSRRSCHLADRALTLHLLERHAPRTFAALGLAAELDAALVALRRVPRDFPGGLPWHEVMARVDALFLPVLRGAPVPRFDRRGLRRALERLDARGHGVLAWLLAALSLRLGVVVPVRAPIPSGEVETRLTELTHDVLISTDYLSHPAPLLAPTLARLREGVPWAVRRGAWDILGELVFCLRAAGVPPHRSAVEALLAAQRADGRFEERGCRDARVRAHTTATCLVALAGELEHRGR